jgi:hypothetical protein
MTLPAPLDVLLDDLRPAAARAAVRDRHRTVVLAIAATVVSLSIFAGVAVAAAKILGGPAPKQVQTNLHLAARGFVNLPGLQTQTAQVVAEAPDVTLYGVSDKRGSYCVELVGATKGLIFAFSCNTTRVTARPGDVPGECCGATIQYVVTDGGVEPPVVRFGRLPLGAVKARAILGNGKVVPIETGIDGFYVYEPSAADQPIARRQPMTIEMLDSSGHPAWTYYLQPPQPLDTEGAMGRYGALPKRISGHVVIDGASRVKIQLGAFSSSKTTTTYVPLSNDGSFDWVVPEGTQNDILTVLDSRGQALTDEIVPLAEPHWRNILAQANGRP